MPKVAKTADKKSVLIVEDSADFSDLLKYIIEDMGFEGVQFPLDKADIVEWAKTHNPEAILMDLQLRRKNGMEYIHELKSDGATKDIPIIVITGRDLTQREILDLQIKGVKYLRKGRIEMDELKNVIRTTLHVQNNGGEKSKKKVSH
jgi:two-component system alkaline phosphatase synthesis response regulator PhoP